MDRSRRRDRNVVSLPRRSVLRALAAAAGGSVLTQAVLATGCGPRGGAGEGKSELRIPLSRLQPGERVEVLLGGHPVELLRRDEAVEARSLTCTHWGCRVRWDAREGVYHCPCHDGKFAQDGRVISGPPPRPLPAIAVTVAGGEVVLDVSAFPHPSPAPA